MPAAIANKETIIAEPKRIEEILREHFTRLGHAKKIAETERKADIAKKVMNPNENLFGKRFWPIVEKTNFDYDYDQLTTAWFTFNAIWLGTRPRNSPGACAHAARFTVQSLIRYANGQEATPVRSNFRRVFDAMLDPWSKAQGWLTAFDAATSTQRWRYQSSKPMIGGVATTGGNLVFIGEITGDFLALDAKAARSQAQRRRPGRGGVVSYAASGKQYVAAVSGFVGGYYNQMAPHIGRENTTVTVFALKS